jgi:hypothetical protein
LRLAEETEIKPKPHGGLRVVILMPLRDDFDSAAELIRQLDRTSSIACILEVIVVDDGSVTSPSAAHFNTQFVAIWQLRAESRQ